MEPRPSVVIFAETLDNDGAEKAPLSAHPAFPAIVALWFAALLGIGSLVLPVVLIERLATVTGIALIVPAAKPPLGLTARVLVALAGSIAGAAIGLFIARKAANGSDAVQRRPRIPAGVERECRPIFAHDELGETGLESPSSPPPPLAHKRPKSVVSEARRYGLLAESGAEDESEPLELDVFTTPGQSPEGDRQGGGPVTEFDWPQDETSTPDPKARHDMPMSNQDFPRAEPTDALPFAAPSFRRSGHAATQGAGHTQASQVPEANLSQDDGHDTEPPSRLTIVERSREPIVDNRPLDELGLVQLAGRLGASIDKRRAWLAQRRCDPSARPAPPVPLENLDHFSAAGASDAARAMADFFEPKTVGEARPGPTGEAPTGPVSLHRSLPSSPRAKDEDEFEDAESDEGDYSSLLAMKNPFARQQDFVRIAQGENDGGAIEAGVAQPGSSHTWARADAESVPQKAKIGGEIPAPSETAVTPLGPDDAERSLRDALARLQRMSGNA
jgi:hypothetical protein